MLPFSANILNSQKFMLKINPNTLHKRLVLDYELDYCMSGNRTMYIQQNYNKDITIKEFAQNVALRRNYGL